MEHCLISQFRNPLPRLPKIKRSCNSHSWDYQTSTSWSQLSLTSMPPILPIRIEYFSNSNSHAIATGVNSCYSPSSMTSCTVLRASQCKLRSHSLFWIQSLSQPKAFQPHFHFPYQRHLLNRKTLAPMPLLEGEKTKRMSKKEISSFLLLSKLNILSTAPTFPFG